MYGTSPDGLSHRWKPAGDSVEPLKLPLDDCRNWLARYYFSRPFTNASAVTLQSSLKTAPTAESRDWSTEPSLKQIGALVAIMYLAFFLVIIMFDTFEHRVFVFGDNVSYAAAATAIRDWQPLSIRPYHFWGLPYVVASVSLLTGLPAFAALVMVSIIPSIVAVTLIHRLWGGWVAGFFVILSWEWLQRSILGGSEPLFVALVVGAFFAARRERWYLCAFLASYSTIVRPQGIFVLAGVALALAAEREWRKLLLATLIGALVGALYMVPMKIYYGDPLANFSYYQGQDWHTGSPISPPFVPVLHALFSWVLPATTLLRTAFWVLLVSLGILAMVGTTHFRLYAVEHKIESTFAALYIFFLFSYNSEWALVEFARFALPVLPLLLFAFKGYLPRDRRLLWAIAPISAVLAAASALNVRHVIETIRWW